MAKPFLFYAARPSYFSAKVRPIFRFKGIPYEEIDPSPDIYREIKRRTGLGFIPVVITPEDEALQDTSEILDVLEKRFPQPAVYPATPLQQVTAYLLEVYADEFCVLPAMHYRWSFPESEAQARQDFAAASGDPQTAESFATRMKGTLPFLGVTPESIPAIEAHLRDMLAALSRHFEKHDFLLGSRMSLADLALFGPFYAHLYLDAVPGKLLRATAPAVCSWIERMNGQTLEPGEFLPDDSLAPTLFPVLSLIGQDAVPLLLDNIHAFQEWADTDPPDLADPPRGVGTHETELRGVRLLRYTSPYTLWMLQRPLDSYMALPAVQRQRVDAVLGLSGLSEWLDFEPRYRLTKRHYRLVCERR